MEEAVQCSRQPGELLEVEEQLVQQYTQGRYRKYREQALDDESYEDHLEAPFGRQESGGQGQLLQLAHGVEDDQLVHLVLGGDCLGSVEKLFQLYLLLFAQQHR